MKTLLAILLMMTCIKLAALTVTDITGLSKEYDINALASLPRLELNASSEKEGKIKEHSFCGIRFDQWLYEQGFQSFGKIRFESGDRYRVSLTKAEMDSLECWLVFASGGKEYEPGSSRLVFPALREMTWIKDVERVILEAQASVPIPVVYQRMDHILQKLLLVKDPPPFVNMEGWFLEFLLPRSELTLYLISADGLMAELEWPRHLEGAILEKYGDKINLKSPQIPGGMWIKDLVYIQYGDTVLIRDKALPHIYELEKTLARNISADTKVIFGDGVTIPLGKLMLEPNLAEQYPCFRIVDIEPVSPESQPGKDGER